jgi:cbb3-type cytochrome oxidase subunit 3
MSQRERSPRRGMCAAVLVLESLTLALSTPVMIAVADVEPSVALPVGLGLALLCLLTSGLLRAEWGYSLGWTIQGAAVALGFLVTTMFFLGGIFALLWASADLLGRKIDRERAAAYRALDEQGGTG